LFKWFLWLFEDIAVWGLDNRADAILGFENYSLNYR